MSRYTQYFGQNNVSSELAVGISSIATTIQLSEDQGDLWGEKFPVLATLEHRDSAGKCTKREIVKVESKSGDTLTVIRKFAPCPVSDDSTSQVAVSNSFDPGDTISIYIPYEILNSVSEAINDLYNNGNDRLFLKKTSGLGFEITPGNVRFETGEAYYPGGTGTVVDNSMNYVMLDSSFNIIVNQEELFDVQNISIAEVKAVNGEITEITSRKIDGIAGRMGGGGDPVYGDGSDGDLVISENTILNAGQQYQFSNLTICQGATVSFTGCGGAKIKVSGLFINEGIIDATDFDVDSHCYRDSTSFCIIKNCTRESACFCPGKGGEPGCANRGGNGCATAGGDAVDPGTGTCCVGCGAYIVNSKGGTGRGCGGGGGKGEYPGCYGTCGACNTSGTMSGIAGSGLNGGKGGDGGQGTYTYNGLSSGGGGGGGFYTGNGGNGGNGYFRSASSGNNEGKLRTKHKLGGDGGNGGILGNGGDGGCGYFIGNGGNGGDGFCRGGNGGDGGGVMIMRRGIYPGGDGGNGGNGYYGGNGGNGGNGCNYTQYGSCYQVRCAGNGGRGGCGMIPGKGGNGGCGIYDGTNNCPGGNGGTGGQGQSYLHSLNIKAKCLCNTGCILSVGAVGGQGGNGGNGGVSGSRGGSGGTGGRGGQGGNGGMIQIITDCVIERGCISVAGGRGGPGGNGGCKGYTGNAGCPGPQGVNGDSGTLYFFMLEG